MIKNRKKEIQERLEREFEVCDRHILRINSALDCLKVEISTLFETEELSDEQVRCVDQFVYRFAKLQDSMGSKIFRQILELLDEDVVGLPMKDVLNKLERYNLISGAEEWNYIRELRNQIAHDYSLSKDETMTMIQELIKKHSIVLNICDSLKNKFNSIKK